MSKVMIEKENCFANIVEKAKTSCCFSFPFGNDIPGCLYFFNASSSEAISGNLSRGFCNLQVPPSKAQQDLPATSLVSKEDDSCRTNSGLQAMPSAVQRNRLVVNERQQKLLESLWLEQHQVVKSQQKNENGFIFDVTTGKRYRKGKLLGKGAFAKCYELTDIETCAVYAGKIIAKSRLSKPHQKEKMEREIDIHRSMCHENVVALCDYFNDDRNVYIILEHCRRKSLDHVLKARKVLTEPEVRYYMRQLVEGCRYIHSQRVIHRDLKPGNMLINGNMQIKIADFGLATRVKYNGEKKHGVCGTPNYVAPEVLNESGYSHEVDAWSIGCIMYTMLCGNPPFEMPTLKETFKRISANKFAVPSHLSPAAKDLIRKLLHPKPTSRPSLDVVLFEDFFTTGFAPSSLSPGCCETAPRFPIGKLLPRPRSFGGASLNQLKVAGQSKHKPLARKMSISQVITKHGSKSNENSNRTDDSPVSQKDFSENALKQETSVAKRLSVSPSYSILTLYKLLAGCLQRISTDVVPFPVSDPNHVSVCKWIDYSNKYGFGFQLSDGSIGVNFNDSTRLILLNDKRTLQYVDLSNKLQTSSVRSVPSELQRKFSLLVYFGNYMDEYLKGSVDQSFVQHQRNVLCTNTIFLKRWFRTEEALVMYLSSGTLQVNFLTDHSKLVLSMVDSQNYIVTYVNASYKSVSYHLSQLCQSGCSTEMAARLQYVRRMLETLINYEEESV